MSLTPTQPLYPSAMRQARTSEVHQDWPRAASLWRQAALSCPAETRERQYCEAQAAACLRVQAMVEANPPQRSALDIAHAHIAGLRAMVKRLKGELDEARNV